MPYTPGIFGEKSSLAHNLGPRKPIKYKSTKMGAMKKAIETKAQGMVERAKGAADSWSKLKR